MFHTIKYFPPLYISSTLCVFAKAAVQLPYTAHKSANISKMHHSFNVFFCFFCFQVIAGVNVRGWLDASSEPTNWMKNIRCTNSNSDVNVQHFLIAGHVSFFAEIFSLFITNAHTPFFFSYGMK
jgi:hypothetical protein